MAQGWASGAKPADYRKVLLLRGHGALIPYLERAGGDRVRLTTLTPNI
jgi:hypothetical protein